MTDPSMPVPSDEAKTAAARILAREYGYDHVWENDVGEEVYDRHYWDHIGKAALTAAYAIDAPRLRGEAGALLAHARELLATKDAAAAEARAATLREVIEMFQTLQPWERNASGTFTGAEAAALVKRMLNPEANRDDT